MTAVALGSLPSAMGEYWASLGPEDRFVVEMFLSARKAVLRAGFEWEIAWQENRSIEEFTESDFLQEAAWVILSSGMKELVIAGLYPQIKNCFGGLRSARIVVANSDRYISAGLKVFAHRPKLSAIVGVANWVEEVGLEAIRSGIRTQGAAALAHLPYLGPATSVHLAKNLGAMVAKPDRHLVRLAESIAIGSPEDICARIAGHLGESIAVVDVVLWRACVLGALRPH